MSRRYSGECPQCRAEDKLRISLVQGDHMRVTGGPTVRMGVKAVIVCVNATDDGYCDYRDESAWVDVTLEFGEAIR